MIVCHCHALSDREIRSAADQGATCCNDVERICGAGDDCGGCRPQVELILRGARVGEEVAAAVAS